MQLQEPALAYNRKNWTIVEYLEMETASETKHEYYRGEVFAMSGALLPHVVVTDNTMFALRRRLNGTGCRPYNDDLRIHIPINGNYIAVYTKRALFLAITINFVTK